MGISVPCGIQIRKAQGGHHENLQLCAQAICLEEMLGVKVEKGAIFWHASRGEERGGLHGGHAGHGRRNGYCRAQDSG